jgi:hypothetical protein
MAKLKPIFKVEDLIEEQRVEEQQHEVEDELERDDEREVKKEVEIKSENNFESLNDFKEYYSKIKKKLDSMCTVMLNKTYKIKDYVIRKNYGDIGFRKISKNVKTSRGDAFEQRIEALENALNEVIEILNSRRGK